MESESYNGIGLMSGTSLDGLDVAEVQFQQTEKEWTFRLVKAQHFDFPKSLSENLFNADKHTASGLVQCDLEFSRFSAKAVNEFKTTFDSKATFISSHGHTIFHQPELGMTHQIGSGAVLSSLVGSTVICDFRSQDVALDGQGAPLVPLADSYLFSNFDCTLNLGGFANLSVLGESLAGYDIAPCNMLLNHLSNEIGQKYDARGSLAMKGKVEYSLLNRLNEISFYDESPPKSLGKEWFETHLLPILEEFKHVDIYDRLATCTEHIAIQSAFQLRSNKTCLVSGGGTHNTFLVERIQHHADTKLHIPSVEIIEYKEAINFAFLGLLRLLEQKNVSSSVTGSTKSHCAGAVYLG
ncbi:MAG: anhydro-N-acetylmuramic acid kinase [Flavobacteriales bacterium]|nr:anhydro-N-acetylmuramic acid kinase [Flavobacteriales bacterium]NCG29910.1 anhydro-N-acetylmuramic acid kinase [Bacteroidota bacterium]MBT3964438.1 anhydro-N-acetylmuramic acid kinase [Flavobacteriales bacterium]MBT4705101.1 anhydro-N-acetylmuramic acid kinase [Flavobacteriales bacterium]MBT4930121.1 anhydro-N-acetylmuramic acid kinase [Flavobacteriales bacterium]